LTPKAPYKFWPESSPLVVMDQLRPNPVRLSTSCR
jgi:hypothetical protein